MEGSLTGVFMCFHRTTAPVRMVVIGGSPEFVKENMLSGRQIGQHRTMRNTMDN